MTAKNRLTLASDASTSLADNTTGNITPATLRQRLGDLSDSAFIKADDTIPAVLGYTPENIAVKGVANGYAGLGSDGLVPASQLPAASAGNPIRYDAAQSLTTGQQNQAISNIGLAGAVRADAVQSFSTSQQQQARTNIGADPIGSVVGSVYAEYTTAGTAITSIIPLDNTIPQVTEGTQILSASITPQTTTNKLRIRFQVIASHATGGTSVVAAVFVNGAANAVAASAATAPAANYAFSVAFEVEVAPGSTSAQAITVRVGTSIAGTITLNPAYFGGANRGTLIIEEIRA